MNELELRQHIVNVANQYLGWAEVNGQDDLIIDRYNDIRPLGGYKMNHRDAWCAAFVSVVKHEAGFDSIIPTECSCQNMINLFKQMRTWQEDGKITPKIGDIIFYNWDDNTQPNDGWADHVGVVTNVVNGTIKVIEGNASDKVKYREIRVGQGFIRGYGLPNYASLVTIPTPQPQPIPTPTPIIVPPAPIPSVQPVPKTVEYRVGNNYTVLVNGLRVRKGPGTNFAVKVRNELTTDGRKNADATGKLNKGTLVTCKELKVDESGNIWLCIPSGWIAATYSGDTYVK